MPIYYSTAAFESLYTYEGDDLGAVWSAEQTTFRVWAPTASAVFVNLYESGTEGTSDLLESIPMTADVSGTWVVTKEGDLNGVYYTYSVTVDGVTREACDPYARTTGVNGKRAMVIDLDSTDPAGWEADRDPHYDDGITDAIIYELHVRDLSSDPSSGIANTGKFLGLTERGTVNSAGLPTGLDHILSLGVTHIHLLPSYDYASVDETDPDAAFNWGYDPVNYNVPEGSYSTDPYNGEVRVREFKQMVKSLHDNGISVVMDVVYNHVYDAESFCFNNIVPGFFSRISREGYYSNGSACGNDTASERAMVKKYIVDSVCYWAEEYHIDGFRFDLAGLIDIDTMNECIAEVHKTHPNVIFYAEGWDMNTNVTKDGYTMATQGNSPQTPGLSFFSDSIRDAIRGSNSNASQAGYAAGGGSGFASGVRNGFLGTANWCKSPSQTVNYASCHDGYSLWDRLTLSTREFSTADRIRMNNLSAAIILTSQGTPLFQAGEELLRSKPLEEGGFSHNSYNLPDSVNAIRWDSLIDGEIQQVRDYYAGLIAFRKAHPALRMTTPEEVAAQITELKGLESSVLGFHIAPGANGEETGLVVIFNPRTAATTVTLPEGLWEIYVDGEKAGLEVLGSAEGTLEVAPISACVLVQAPVTQPETQPTEPVQAEPQPLPTGSTVDIAGLILTILSGAAVLGYALHLNKKEGAH
ncbi:MAG: type I pullulanase [Oscillospiraceae bacterium]|nr:type I pullulanase [Oscillospiraceae bacterium]